MNDVTSTFRPAVFPADIMYDENLTSSQRLILIVLFTYTNAHTNTAFPSYQTIAERSGFERRTCIKLVDELITKGYIEKQENYTKTKGGKPNQTSNLYTLHFKERQVGSDFKSLGGSDLKSLGVVNDDHRGSDLKSPKLSIGTIHCDLNNNDEEKIENEDFKKSVHLWENIMGNAISGVENDYIDEWISQFNMPFEMVKEAVDRMIALNIRPRNIRYVDSITRGWHKSGIKTLQAAKEEVLDREASKLKKRQGNKPLKQGEQKPVEPSSSKYDKFYL